MEPKEKKRLMAEMAHQTQLKKELIKVLEARKHENVEMGKQDEEFERLAALSIKALRAELKALRKELSHAAVSKMPKYQLVNEILRIKFMLEHDSHVPYTKEEVDDVRTKPTKSEAKRAKLSSDALASAVPPVDTMVLADKKETKIERKMAYPLLKRVQAKRKQGMSLADAWKAVKAEDAKKA